MPEWVQVYAKAITALLTSLVMFWLKSRVDLAMFGGDVTLQTVISMTMDGLSALVIGFMTWLIPLGQKYWHQRILGEDVKVLTDDGQVKAGTVIEITPKEGTAP